MVVAAGNLGLRGAALSPSGLIGRDDDVARLIDLITRSRIVTVIGAGGVGKTTLAVDVARRTAESFAGGVAFVDLAHLDDPAAVAAEIARRLDLVDVAGSDSLQQLVTYLRDQRALLVLDNFEQLVEAAPLLAELSAHCPDVVWLVTSRRRLGVTAEQVLELAPLPVPTADGAANPASVASVALFCERAAAVSPGFQPDADELAAVGALCRRVDGLPLAIELVAAHVRLLPPQALLARMDERDLDLGLLKGGPVDADARHRDLRRTIAWSANLLGPDATRLFPRLAVFRQGFTLDALEKVCSGDLPAGHSFEALVELVDLHLVEPVDVDGGEARFRLHETVRQFASEALAESGDMGELRDRHTDYFVAFAARAGAGLESRDERRWAASVGRELPNLRAAMRHLWETGQAERGLSVATALGPHWLDRATMSEGRDWISRFLPATTRWPELQAVADGWRGRFDAELGDVVSAERVASMRRARDVLRQAGDVTAWLRISCQLVAVLRLAGQRAEAEAVVVDTLASADSPASDWFWAELLQMEAILTLDRGDYDHLAALVASLVPTAREVGHDRVRANALTYRAWAVVGRAGSAVPRQPDAAQAAADADEAHELSGQIGDRRGAARAAAAAALVALGGGQHARAAALYSRCLELAVAMGYWRYVAWSMMGALALAAQCGQPTDGARIYGAMAPTLDLVRTQTPRPMLPSFDAAVARLRDELGESFESAAWAGELAGWAAAIDTARRLLTEMAGDAARAPGDSPDETSSRDDPQLTSREGEVLRLLVGGSSNQQIAEELGISAKTVMHHTSAVYRKLDVRGRAEAVAHAIRRGLVDG